MVIGFKIAADHCSGRRDISILEVGATTYHLINIVINSVVIYSLCGMLCHIILSMVRDGNLAILNFKSSIFIRKVDWITLKIISQFIVCTICNYNFLTFVIPLSVIFNNYFVIRISYSLTFYYLLFLIYHLLFIIYHLSFIFYYLLCIMYHVLCIM